MSHFYLTAHVACTVVTLRALSKISASAGLVSHNTASTASTDLESYATRKDDARNSILPSAETYEPCCSTLSLFSRRRSLSCCSMSSFWRVSCLYVRINSSNIKTPSKRSLILADHTQVPYSKREAHSNLRPTYRY